MIMKQIANLNAIDKIYKPYNSERILVSAGPQHTSLDMSKNLMWRLEGGTSLTHRVGIANSKIIKIMLFCQFSEFLFFHPLGGGTLRL